MVKEKNISQIADLWQEEKKQFVKKSTYAAYSLIVETHLLPAFGNLTLVTEKDVQVFVLSKLESGLSQKTIKDMLIVLRMILKFGAKNSIVLICRLMLFSRQNGNIRILRCYLLRIKGKSSIMCARILLFAISVFLSV